MGRVMQATSLWLGDPKLLFGLQAEDLEVEEDGLDVEEGEAAKS